jgi:hypothetical protein
VALHAAERALGIPADTRPAVVREVVERTTVRTTTRLVPSLSPSWSAPTSAAPGADTNAGAGPLRAQAREQQLAVLLAQLRDSDGVLAREHWHHRRLYEALAAVVHALGRLAEH